MHRKLDLSERTLAEGLYDGVLSYTSLWISRFEAGILAKVQVLAGVVVPMVGTVWMGGRLRVLLLLLLLGLLLVLGLVLVMLLVWLWL